MPDEQSIFEFLQPQAPQGGLRGALTGGLRDLSDFFQQETPKLLQNEDAGAGEVFAASFLGGLGAPSRRREAAAAQRRKTAMQFLPNIWGQLDTGTQEEIAGTFLPGVKLRDQLTDTEKQLFDEASKAIRDPKVPVEDRKRFAEIMMQLDPDMEDGVDNALASVGVESSPDRQWTFMQALLRDNSPESVGKFEDSGFEDWSLLDGQGKKEDGDLSPSQQFNADAFKGYLLIKEHQEKFGTSASEAASALGIGELEFANIARATGMSSAQGDVVTKGDLYWRAVNQVMRDDLGMSLSDLGDLDAETVDNVFKKVNTLFPVMVQGHEEMGIPIVGGTPSPRSPAAFDLAQQRIEKGRALEAAADKLIAEGDQRARESIMIELAETGDFD